MRYIFVVLISMLGITATAQENFKGTSTDSIFTFVEQMPQFVGGDAEMMKFISTHLHYPTLKDEDGIGCSRIVVRFVVSKTGKLGNITVKKGNADCAKSLVEVIEQMPNWIPGKQNGKSVDVYYTIPLFLNFQK